MPGLYRDYTTPKRLKVTDSTSRMLNSATSEPVLRPSKSGLVGLGLAGLG